MRLRSTANVFACRPADELSRTCLGFRARSCRRGRLELVEPNAGPQQIVAALGIARVHRLYVGRRERVGEDAHLARRAWPARRGRRCRSSPGTKYGETRSSVFSGRPIVRTSSGNSSTSVRAVVSSVLAGSSYTSCAVVHSSASCRSSKSRTTAGSRAPRRGRRPIPGRRASPRTWPRDWRRPPAPARPRSSPPDRRTGCSSRDRTPSTRRAPPGRPRARRGRRTPTPLPAPKYSLPTLRPPTTLTWLSAVNDLLCMRRFTRVKSVRKLSARASRWTTGL